MGGPPRPAPLDDVAKFATDLETGPLLCRGDSHVWSPSSSRVREGDGMIYWTKDCDQCGTVRTITYAKSGHVIRRQYYYPAGYRRKGLGPMSADGKAILRVEMFLRLEDG